MQKNYILLMILIMTLLSASCSNKREVPKNLKEYGDNLLEHAYMDKLPGAVIVVSQGDEIIYRGARGHASVELNVALTGDQVFRIASVTKQFTATAILSLVDDGKINLHDPLSTFLPDYPNGKNITVLQLLNHTSGIKSHTSIEGIMSGPIRLDVTTAQLINMFKDLPTDFPPGTDYSYNNSGYILLGAILEFISGVPWYDYLEQTLLIPNKLKNTEYGGDRRLILKMATGYGTVPIEEGVNLAKAEFVSMTQPHAAGGLVSTAEDLIRWNRLLHNGELLKSNTYEAMITPQGKAIKEGYGFGIRRKLLRGETMLSHGGGIHGFSSYLLYLPESEISVAIIQNADSKILSMKHSEVAKRIAAFALGNPFPESIEVALDEKTLRAYEGVYKINEQKTYELRFLYGGLTVKMNQGMPIRLTPIGEDRFLFPKELNMIKVIRHSNGNIKGLQEDNESEFAKITSHKLPNESVTVKNVSKDQKERITGHYQGRPGLLKVELTNDGKITVQLEGQDALEFQAQTPDLYFLKGNGSTLEFAKGNSAPSVKLSQGNRTAILNRVVE